MSVYTRDTKHTLGKHTNIGFDDGSDDDWETDPDFENNVTEEESRWGSAQGSARGAVDTNIDSIRNRAKNLNDDSLNNEYESRGKFSRGYGGDHGVQNVMDKSALRNEDVPQANSYRRQVEAPDAGNVGNFRNNFEAKAAEQAPKAKPNFGTGKKWKASAPAAPAAAPEPEYYEEEAGGEEWAEEAGGEEWAEEAGGEEWAEEAGGEEWAEEAGGEEWAGEEAGGEEWAEEGAGEEWAGEEAGGEEWAEEGAGEEWAEEGGEEEWAEDGGEDGEWEEAVCTFPYEAADETEISLTEGETVWVSEKIDEGWWSGQNSAGEAGLFPSNYVELV